MRRLFIAIAVFMLLGGTSAAEEAAILVVMSKASPEEITAKTVERIFLKRKLLWKDSSGIVAVNLPSNNPLREKFNEKVLKRSRRELVDYWNAEHFKGVDPPDVLESEDAVKKFIKEVPGSVGYISPGSLEDGLIVVYTVR